MTAALPATRLRLGLIAVFLLFDTAVQIAFKLAARDLGDGALDPAWLAAAARSPAVWGAVLLYMIVFVLWMLILQQIELSRAFPLTALTYITVPAAGLLLFHETVDTEQAAGIALILVGVVLVSWHD
ncbi:MAG: EamA family transporter [Sporichthyaceae bacterium]